MEKYLWLTSSCFLPLGEWNRLLTELARFISGLPADSYRFYQLRFSHKNGDNIELAMLTNGEKVEQVGWQLDKQLDQFFSAYPGINPQAPITSMYLPFPTATLQFGLYNMGVDESSYPDYTFGQLLSEMMVRALQHEEEVTHETITTFAFYLQMGLVKVCKAWFGNDIDGLFGLLAPGDAAHARFDPEAFAENDSLVQDIAAEVMEEDEFTDELDWLNTWIAGLRSGLQEKLEKSDGQNEFDILKTYYQHTTAKICRQLALADQVKELVNHLVNRSLWKFYQS